MDAARSWLDPLLSLLFHDIYVFNFYHLCIQHLVVLPLRRRLPFVHYIAFLVSSSQFTPFHELARNGGVRARGPVPGGRVKQGRLRAKSMAPYIVTRNTERDGILMTQTFITLFILC